MIMWFYPFVNCSELLARVLPMLIIYIFMSDSSPWFITH